MKQIISAKYRRFVLYVEIFMVILLLPVLYNFVPVNHTTTTFYIPSSHIDDVTQTLEKSGYTFKSNSDTEVVLKAFHKWRFECVHKFRGMWAFAIWDKKSRN